MRTLFLLVVLLALARPGWSQNTVTQGGLGPPVGACQSFVQRYVDLTGSDEYFCVPPAWVLNGGGGGGMAIGDVVTGGTPGSSLFVDNAGDLGQDNARYFWNDTLFQLIIGGDIIPATVPSTSDDVGTDTAPFSGVNAYLITARRRGTGIGNGETWGLRVERPDAMDQFVSFGQASTTYTTGGTVGWIQNGMPFLYFNSLDTLRMGAGTGSTPWLEVVGSNFQTTFNGNTILGASKYLQVTGAAGFAPTTQGAIGFDTTDDTLGTGNGASFDKYAKAASIYNVVTDNTFPCGDGASLITCTLVAGFNFYTAATHTFSSYTASGNSAEVGTSTAGAKTTSNCASWDANDNLQDSGISCGVLPTQVAASFLLDTVNTNTIEYASFWGATSFGTDGTRQMILAKAITVTKFCVQTATAQPGDNSLVIDLMDDAGAVTGFTITFATGAAAALSCVTPTEQAIAVNSVINVRFDNNDTMAASASVRQIWIEYRF